MGDKKTKGKAGASLEDALLSQETAASKSELKLPILEDGLTVEELSLKMGRSVSWVRERLRVMANEGRLEVGRKKKLNILGFVAWYPSYKIKP
jgi:hypothetical protein